MSIKTIRVYHDKGLLAEPGRDASGYRRYNAQDAIDLIKIRTLAEEGSARADPSPQSSTGPWCSSARSPRSSTISPRVSEACAPPNSDYGKSPPATPICFLRRSATTSSGSASSDSVSDGSRWKATCGSSSSPRTRT